MLSAKLEFVDKMMKAVTGFDLEDALDTLVSSFDVETEAKKIEEAIKRRIVNSPFNGYLRVEYQPPIDDQAFCGILFKGFLNGYFAVFELRGERACVNRIHAYPDIYDAIWKLVEHGNTVLRSDKKTFKHWESLVNGTDDDGSDE